MQRNLARRIKDEITIWRVGALPGFVVIALIIIARLTGSMQFLEWITLDYFLRLRPIESIDERIVIIGINEADIKNVGHPVPDKEIAAMLKKLQEYKPRVIGLDIVRDRSVNPGHNELVKVFKESKNIIGIEKVLPDKFAPPPDLPSNQIGFSDKICDQDGKCRRILIEVPSSQGYKHSFSLRLVEAYLSRDGISLQNGTCDRETMRFTSIQNGRCDPSTELPRFSPNTGGYVNTDAGGLQVLLNFRNGGERFRTLSLNDIKTGKFNPDWVRDHIVIIGMTTPSAPDFVITSAIANMKIPGEIYGAEFHAHSASQIISAVLNGQPLLKSWSNSWTYVWILGWGFFGISLGRLTQSAWKNLLAVGVASLCLIGIGYFELLIWGWWIPIAPVLLILAINGVGLSAFAFYQYDKALKSQILVRQRAIEMAFTEIHNGPLQTLAVLMRNVQNQELGKEQLLERLQTLNREIRSIDEHLTQNALDKEEILCLGCGLKVDLKRPINDLFYQVYSSADERKLPEFPTLKVKVCSFEPIEEHYLSISQKREICQFLEEALCNVGKHAKGVTRLIALGTKKDGWYTLKIEDNGPGIQSSYESKGTKHGKNLAKQIGGFFNRKSLSPQGTMCELTWPLKDKIWNLQKIKSILKSFLQKS